jgi:hypothetical protein
VPLETVELHLLVQLVAQPFITLAAVAVELIFTEVFLPLV